MAFNIETFRGNIKTNFLHNNKFELIVVPPAKLRNLVDTIGLGESQNNSLQISRELLFRCEATTIPGIQMTTHEVRQFGYGVFRRKPFSTIFTDLNVTITSDEMGRTWKFFKEWHNIVFRTNELGFDGSGKLFNVSYLRDYAGTLELRIYNNMGELVLTIDFTDAFPIFIGDIRMSWEITNQVMKIPISFSFFKFNNRNNIENQRLLERE